MLIHAFCSNVHPFLLATQQWVHLTLVLLFYLASSICVIAGLSLLLQVQSSRWNGGWRTRNIPHHLHFKRASKGMLNMFLQQCQCKTFEQKAYSIQCQCKEIQFLDRIFHVKKKQRGLGRSHLCHVVHFITNNSNPLQRVNLWLIKGLTYGKSKG